jgi:hypothetical protein
MKLPFAALVATVFAISATAQEMRPTPLPRLKLDPVSREVVVTDAPKAEPATATAATPVVMEKYVVRGFGGVPRQTPRQEEVTGSFSLLKGGKITDGKLGGARYEVGLWPMLEFTKAGSSSPREDGPRLRLDLFRLMW